MLKENEMEKRAKNDMSEEIENGCSKDENCSENVAWGRHTVSKVQILTNKNENAFHIFPRLNNFTNATKNSFKTCVFSVLSGNPS